MTGALFTVRLLKWKSSQTQPRLPLLLLCAFPVKHLNIKYPRRRVPWASVLEPGTLRGEGSSPEPLGLS